MCTMLFMCRYISAEAPKSDAAGGPPALTWQERTGGPHQELTMYILSLPWQQIRECDLAAPEQPQLGPWFILHCAYRWMNMKRHQSYLGRVCEVMACKAKSKAELQSITLSPRSVSYMHC
jgi:hypothetical protein